MQSTTIYRVLLAAQILSCLILSPKDIRAAEPNVYISEIAWTGSSLSTADEWIELVNPTNDDLMIGGWRIMGAGASRKALILPADALIPAGGAYLISNYPSDDPHCALNIQPNVVTTTISLSNSVLDIQLFNANDEIIDRAGNGNAPPAGYSEAAKATMVRTDFLMSGDLAEAWKTTETSQNLNTSDFGTPGLVDIPIVDLDPLPEIPTSPTSTETIFEPTTSTTTDNVVTSVTSTEIEIILPDSFPSSTEGTTTTVLTVENATTTQSELISDTTSTFDPSNVQFLRLNEVMPDPADGSEWVEITNAMPDRNISLEGLELHDAVGKFMTLKGSVTSGHLYVVANLSSARLNNSGDSLYLKTPDGNVIDSLTYASSQEGVTWARDAQGAWRETIISTPGSENAISDKPTQIVSDSKYEPITVKAKKTTVKITKPKENPVKKVSTTTTGRTTAKQTAAKVQISAEKKTVTPKTTAKKTTVKKTTTKSTTTVKAPIVIDFDMLNDDSYGGIRVKLKGQVGSAARLLTGRAFVLLNPEGRGLLVKVPSGKKMPTLNSSLEVTGTLKFDTYDFPYLTLTKNDRLTELKSATTSSIREVTWWAPALEDAWSLVAATGTVQAVSGSTISLLVDDTEVDLKIKSGVNYRASRLKKGDLIGVTGLLDMTSQRPAILPRQADEINLISYAPKSIQQASEPTKPSGLPGWTPFGAALGAIGAVEGVKKIRNRKKPVKA